MKKVGIIGCGSIAQVHAWVLGSMEDVEICALCDVDASRARNIADKYLNDEKEIENRFFAPLEFGTAGLRGTMKVGLHHMNIHIIRHATQRALDLGNRVMEFLTHIVLREWDGGEHDRAVSRGTRMKRRRQVVTSQRKVELVIGQRTALENLRRMKLRFARGGVGVLERHG